jgi:hypothetical protein
MRGVVALREVAPLTALRAPASINAARVAINVFCIFTTSDQSCFACKKLTQMVSNYLVNTLDKTQIITQPSNGAQKCAQESRQIWNPDSHYIAGDAEFQRFRALGGYEGTCTNRVKTLPSASRGVFSRDCTTPLAFA